MWKISQDKYESCPSIINWITNCKSYGDGIYAQCVPLNSCENEYIYIVFRFHVTDDDKGKILSCPLRKRFIAKYKSGSNYEEIDIIHLTAKSDFQLFLSIDSNKEYYSSVYMSDPDFDNEVFMLYNSLD